MIGIKKTTRMSSIGLECIVIHHVPVPLRLAMEALDNPTPNSFLAMLLLMSI